MTTGQRSFRVRNAIGDSVQGPVLVTQVPFSARYDLDWETGRFSRLGHPLDGVSIAGTILVCPSVQGGVATGWALLSLASRGVCFAGLVFGRVNPVMVQGAQAAAIPIAAGVDRAIFEHLEGSELMRLSPDKLEVALLD
jgi:predicted aconitase with swiveling domain